MDRRDFFKTFGVAMAAYTMDPEKLLWVPGSKTIFIPPEKKVEIAEEWEMDLLKLNQYAFATLYTSSSDVIKDSERLKKDPFELYYDNYRNWWHWKRKEI